MRRTSNPVAAWIRTCCRGWSLAAFRSNEDERAIDYLELAYLRGHTGVGAVLEALDAREEGEPGSDAEAGLSEAWRAAIAERYGDDPQ